MAPFRKLKIALDFDRTFTSDIDFWRFFVHMAARRGHSVLCVTGRTDTPESRQELTTLFGVSALSRLTDLVFCDHAPKRQAALAAGHTVDIWIDDLPEGVGAAGKRVFKQLESMFPVCETLPVFHKDAISPTSVWTP